MKSIHCKSHFSKISIQAIKMNRKPHIPQQGRIMFHRSHMFVTHPPHLCPLTGTGERPAGQRWCFIAISKHIKIKLCVFMQGLKEQISLWLRQCFGLTESGRNSGPGAMKSQGLCNLKLSTLRLNEVCVLCQASTDPLRLRSSCSGAFREDQDWEAAVKRLIWNSQV